MIYTTYFAKVRGLPWDLTPVSIALFKPRWYSGLEYLKLAPTKEILLDYKNDLDKEKYQKDFIDQVLNNLSVDKVLQELAELTGNKNNIALVCYERPEDFCHRHIVSDWLNKNGIECREYS